MKTKTCTKCHKTKLISEFHKNKSTKDGYSCWCKECVKEYAKKYGKFYYENHKKERNKYSNWYNKIHKQEIKKLLKGLLKECRDLENCPTCIQILVDGYTTKITALFNSSKTKLDDIPINPKKMQQIEKGARLI